MTAALLILGLLLFALVLQSRRRHAASKRPVPLDHERDLRSLQDSYTAGEITLERFEAEVWDVLKAEPPARAIGTKPPSAAPVNYSERWEIHVHDAPPHHELHIHLS
jgi:hypothetical protein